MAAFPTQFLQRSTPRSSVLGAAPLTSVGIVDADAYKQHNLGAEDGLEGFTKLLQTLPPGSARVHTMRVFEEGNFVLVVSEGSIADKAHLVLRSRADRERQDHAARRNARDRSVVGRRSSS